MSARRSKSFKPRPCRDATRVAWLGLALATFAGCSSLFGIDVPPLVEEALAGAGGSEAGAAGFAATETGGTDVVEQAGGSGALSGEGGAGSGGAGRAAGGAGRGGAGRGGTTGAKGGGSGRGTAGSSTAGELARSGAPCDRTGARACPAASSTSSLSCEGGKWVLGSSCYSGQYCDRRNGICTSIYGGCADTSPGGKRCRQNPFGGDDAVICGPDLVTAELEHCIFGCVDDVGCIEASGTNLVLEPAPPPVATDRAYWPGPNIPVCIVNPEQAESSTVEDEVLRTWGRYGGVTFTGFGACDEQTTGVIVRLRPHSEPCNGELGAVDRVGYPGASGSVQVDLCTRYYDASGGLTTASEELRRLVIRHEFGHVLGFADAGTPNITGDFMARGIDTAHLDGYGFSSSAVGMLAEAYGRKPAGALVDERGACLTLTGGALSFETCDASAAQAFALVGGELAHPSTAECVAAAPSAAASAVACSPGAPAADAAWQPAEVEIHGFGAECMYVNDETGGLSVHDCPNFGSLDALWAVELVDGGTRLRVRRAGGTDCVTIDPDTLELALQTCDDCAPSEPTCATADRLTLTQAGQIRWGGYCLAATVFDGPGHNDLPSFGPVLLAPCSLAPAMLWNLSGRIESDAGMALTRGLDAASPVLAATPIGEGSLGSQIFDFYFWDSAP